MTKDELITRVSRNTMYGRMTVSEILDDILSVISESLVNSDKVVIKGFGTFQTIERKAKVGRNVRAGTPVHIPAHIAPEFKPSKVLKEKVYKEI